MREARTLTLEVPFARRTGPGCTELDLPVVTAGYFPDAYSAVRNCQKRHRVPAARKQNSS
jgi:hypothetical protein